MAGLACYMIYRLCTRSSMMRAAAAAQAMPPEAAITGGISGENLGTATPSAPPQPLHVAIFTSTCAICLNDIEDGERLLVASTRSRVVNVLLIKPILFNDTSAESSTLEVRAASIFNVRRLKDTEVSVPPSSHSLKRLDISRGASKWWLPLMLQVYFSCNHEKRIEGQKDRNLMSLSYQQSSRAKTSAL
ncbi:hypothetical protein RJ640_005717 [Escallonia rubra]|uniref:Uncharacterized protein n=1 Tax=Escallonia rubra TaxID=112253 RepID=A0AA88SJA7_9ASTE|nr:hypothetical protein RJ640_005717 [Escallonia rubra]